MFSKLKELFTIPKEGRMSERTFFAQLTLSIIVIVLCLTAMVVTAYKLFGYEADAGQTEFQVSPPTEAVRIVKAPGLPCTVLLPDGSTAYTVL